MQGTTGSYAINGTELTLQPTQGRWNEAQDYGFDGTGHPIYSSVRTFELSWGIESPAELNQLITFFETVRATGTVAIDLPQRNSNDYSFYRYSGCTLSDLRTGEYFEKHIQDVRLLIYGIRA